MYAPGSRPSAMPASSFSAAASLLSDGAAAGARAAAGPDAEAGEDAVLSSLQAWFHADSVDAYMEVRHNANF